MWKQYDLPVDISFGAFLLTGWFALVNGWRLTVLIFFAAVLHELGHLVVLCLAGAKITGFRVGVFGAVLEADTQWLSYGWELAAVLAGPATNLAAAVTCGALGGSSVFVGINVILCCFNLLPVYPLDGGRAIRLLLVWRCGPGRGERLAGCIGGAVALLLAAWLGFLMYRTGGSLWLLPPACWLFATGICEIWENDEKILLFL